MRVFIHRNRYAIGACAVALAAVALLGFYGITQANAAENGTADAGIEQRWEGDLEAQGANDKAAELIETQGPEGTTETGSPANDEAVNAEIDGVEETPGEDSARNTTVDEDREPDAEADKARTAYLIPDEPSTSSECLEINASPHDEAEREERQTA